MSVTISKPRVFDPDTEYLKYDIDGTAVIMEVTITNNSPERIEGSEFNTFTVSGGEASNTIISVDRGTGFPAGSIRSGGSLTFKIANDVADTSDVEVEVNRLFSDYETVYFQTFNN